MDVYPSNAGEGVEVQTEYSRSPVGVHCRSAVRGGEMACAYPSILAPPKQCSAFNWNRGNRLLSTRRPRRPDESIALRQLPVIQSRWASESRPIP